MDVRDDKSSGEDDRRRREKSRPRRRSVSESDSDSDSDRSRHKNRRDRARSRRKEESSYSYDSSHSESHSESSSEPPRRRTEPKQPATIETVRAPATTTKQGARVVWDYKGVFGTPRLVAATRYIAILGACAAVVATISQVLVPAFRLVANWFIMFFVVFCCLLICLADFKVRDLDTNMEVYCQILLRPTGKGFMLLVFGFLTYPNRWANPPQIVGSVFSIITLILGFIVYSIGLSI